MSPPAAVEDRQIVRPVGRPGWLAAPGILWLIVFMVVPLMFMVIVSFWSSGYYGTKPDFTFKNYLKLIESPLYSGQLLKTLRIGVEATVISLIVSYPIAYMLARARGTGDQWRGCRRHSGTRAQTNSLHSIWQGLWR